MKFLFTAEDLRDRLVDLIRNDRPIGGVLAMYAPIFAAVESANCTEAALVNGNPHEFLVRSENPEFCKDCRKLFWQYSQKLCNAGEVFLLGF